MAARAELRLSEASRQHDDAGLFDQNLSCSHPQLTISSDLFEKRLGGLVRHTEPPGVPRRVFGCPNTQPMVHDHVYVRRMAVDLVRRHPESKVVFFKISFDVLES